MDILDCVYRWPPNVLRRKRRRKRGNHGGFIVKLKAYRRAGFLSVPPRASFCGGSTIWRPPDRVYQWLHPVFPLHLSPVVGAGLCRVGLGCRQRGATCGNLCSLSRASSSSVIIPAPKLALINARSLVNKTFLINDFYSSHNLDFMFITESWMKAGDLTPFADLVPADCTFFNSPCLCGQGGGIVTILKNSFSARCRLSPIMAFSSFEAQLLYVDWNGPVSLGLIYRPPHSTKDFIQQ